MRAAACESVRDDFDFRRHGIGDEAFLVRFFMQPFEIGRRRLLRAGVGDFGMQLDACDGELALRVLFEMSDRRVVVAVDDESLVRCERQERGIRAWQAGLPRTCLRCSY